jgi:hypothetical protein
MGTRLDDQKIKEMFKEYENSTEINISELARKYGFSRSIFHELRVKYNILEKDRLDTKYPKSFIEKIHKEYFYEKRSLVSLYKEYKIKPFRLKERFIKYNLPLLNIKQGLNLDFFDSIDSEIKAYLLGFIAGDGSISEEGLHIRVVYKDIFILKLFQKYLNPKAEIKHLYLENQQDQVIINFYSVELINKLQKHGIVKNKTYIPMNIPQMPKKLIRHFIRGYFDADGTASFRVQTNKKTGNTKGNTFKAAFTAHLSELLKEVQKELDAFGIKSTLNYYKNNKGRYYYSLVLSLSSLDLFENYLYQDSNFYLLRKREKFLFRMLTPREALVLKDQEPRNA